MGKIDHRTEVREFLSSRRARITPEQAGLPAYGSNRRVAGLRREEVAMLAGVSIDYYVRMERGNLAGVSESVLDALVRALQLDEAERDHLYALAKTAADTGGRRRRTPPTSVRPAIQQVLDAITDAPAWVRNGRHDIVAMNRPRPRRVPLRRRAGDGAYRHVGVYGAACRGAPDRCATRLRRF
jgi:transcriptional regulator with XRE-family HTH domain